MRIIVIDKHNRTPVNIIHQAISSVPETVKFNAFIWNLHNRVDCDKRKAVVLVNCKKKVGTFRSSGG